MVCISGLKDSGKTESAQMLEYILNSPRIFRSYFWYKIFKTWRGKWKTTAFAKPLKQTLSIILNKPLNWFEDRVNKEMYYVNLDTLEIFPKEQVWDLRKLSESKFSKLIKNGEPFAQMYWLTIRQLMQYYGTSVIRGCLGDKVWINATLNAAKSKNVIISDLRFIVEYKEVKKRNGIVIYIQRDSAVPGTHASEREVLELLDNGKFDYIVNNNGSLKDLFNNLKAIC